MIATEFAQSMERVERCVAALAEQQDQRVSQTAADLLNEIGNLHRMGLRQMPALVNSGGESYRPLLERFVQDDLIRTLLFYHGLHPIPLLARLEEAIGNLRPLIVSYGGSVSLGETSPDCAVIYLDIAASSSSATVWMIKRLLKDALLVAALDVADIRFVDGVAPVRPYQLPMVHSE